MERKQTQKELVARPKDPEIAQELGERVLGPEIDVDYLRLPRNVGVMGDEGVRGHTILISGQSLETRVWFGRHHEIIDRLASRIIADTEGASRVLIDITPPDRRAEDFFAPPGSE